MPPNISFDRPSLSGLAAEGGSFGPALKVFVMVVAMALAGLRPLSACSCIEIPGDPNAPPSEVAGDDPDSVVILGTVESVKLDGDWPKGYDGGVVPTLASLRVDRYWGGARLSSTIDVHTENVGGACGVPWQVGECWLIQAWRSEGSTTWQSSTCSITTRVAGKPDVVSRLIATDGPGRVP